VLGSEFLAGATASLAEGIGNLVRTLEMPLHDALNLATINPGHFVPGRGKLEAGSRADLLRFRWREAILIDEVWLAGDRVYSNPEASDLNLGPRA
jgi:N-acetylglucosamine-6-phosphate deacetylase